MKLKTKKSIVVYYHHDEDGFGAAWSAWKKFGNKAEYVEINYDKKDEISEHKNREIYFLDFCPAEKVIKKLLRTGKKVVVIDHHISSKSLVKSVPEHVYGNKNSGAVLSWKYFHSGKKVPKLLEYIEDMDIWKWKIKNTKEILNVLFLREKDFKVWNKVAQDLEDGKKRKKYIEEGLVVEKYKEKILDKILDKAEKASLEGKKAWVVNSPVFGSEIGGILVKNKNTIGVIWSYRNGEINVSVRSKKKLADVSKIAQKFGGGGHRNAAGFSVSKKIKLPWKQ
ncbi:MAG TPA: hypothetical protein ENG99_00835 [bacterium]|nr:hypothetical protein [bacterium]